MNTNTITFKKIKPFRAWANYVVSLDSSFADELSDIGKSIAEGNIEELELCYKKPNNHNLLSSPEPKYISLDC